MDSEQIDDMIQKQRKAEKNGDKPKKQRVKRSLLINRNDLSSKLLIKSPYPKLCPMLY